MTRMLFCIVKMESGICLGEQAMKFPVSCFLVSVPYFASGCLGEQTQATGAVQSSLKKSGDIF